MATYTERLILIQNAIDAILSGAQEVWYLNRRVRFADLAELRQLEIEYRSLSAIETKRASKRSNITYVIPQ